LSLAAQTSLRLALFCRTDAAN